MKHGKNPTVAQKELLKGKGFNPDNWLVVKNLPNKLVVKHRTRPSIRDILKGGENQL